jgi:hypothetical protein
LEELLVSSLVQTDALSKLLIEKTLITREEFMERILEERATSKKGQSPTNLPKDRRIYMFQHSTTASSFSILIAALIFSFSLTGVAAAQGNTSLGNGALQNNTTGSFNTATGNSALFSNTTGSQNTANGVNALVLNTTGAFNTANGVNALFSNTAIPPAEAVRSC